MSTFIEASRRLRRHTAHLTTATFVSAGYCRRECSPDPNRTLAHVYDIIAVYFFHAIDTFTIIGPQLSLSNDGERVTYSQYDENKFDDILSFQSAFGEREIMTGKYVWKIRLSAVNTKGILKKEVTQPVVGIGVSSLCEFVDGDFTTYDNSANRPFAIISLNPHWNGVHFGEGYVRLTAGVHMHEVLGIGKISSKYEKSNSAFVQRDNDVLTVELDLDDLEVTFSLNDEFVACVDNLKTGVSFRIAVIMACAEDSLDIIDSYYMYDS